MISVIMPVYNSESYISSAIISVLNQTYPDFELLIIDDGSTDKSSIICEQFAMQDERIRVFYKENGGVSSARNLGIKEAKGEYVGFIDNDDEYELDYLKVFAKLIEQNTPEILKCGRKNIRISSQMKKISESSNYFSENKCYSFDEFIENYPRLKSSGCMGSVWNGLYKKSFIDKYDLKFREDLKHGIEDLIFNYESFLKEPRIALTVEVLYNHYYRVAHSTSLKFYDDQIYFAIESIKLEETLIERLDNNEDKTILCFDNARVCFRQLSLSKNKKTRETLSRYIESELKLSKIKIKKNCLKKMNVKQKLDLILLSKGKYGLYFLYRDIQKKVENLFYLYKS